MKNFRESLIYSFFRTVTDSYSLLEIKEITKLDAERVKVNEKSVFFHKIRLRIDQFLFLTMIALRYIHKIFFSPVSNGMCHLVN